MPPLSMINILEVVESDFSTALAKEETEEADASTEYDKTTQENKIAKTTMDQDVKYKTQEFKTLDKEITELTGDKDTTSNELGAVLEYYGKLKDRGVAKPETYAERRVRREAEIAGLKEALDVLENETAFVQRKRRGLRGVMASSRGRDCWPQRSFGCVGERDCLCTAQASWSAGSDGSLRLHETTRDVSKDQRMR